MKPPTRPHVGRPENRSDAESGAHRSKRRRPVVDPKTQEPVKKDPSAKAGEEPTDSAAKVSASGESLSETTISQGSGATDDLASGGSSESSEALGSSSAGADIYTGTSSKVNTELMDRLEEREFLRRHARHIRVATLVGILLGVGVVSFVVFFSPLFAYHLDKCVVNGAKTTDVAAICQATAGFEGTPLTRLAAGPVEKAVLKAVPALQDVKMSRSWLQGIDLKVVERVPVATVRQNGKVVGIDRDSVVLEVAPGDVDGLPRVDVDVEKLGGKTEKLVVAALSALGDMPGELRAEIEAVTSQDAAQLTFAMRDGRELIWGNSKDSVEKAQVAKLLFTVQGVKVVDVSNPERPSTR